MAYDWIKQEEILVDDDYNVRLRDNQYAIDLARHIDKHGYDEKYPCIVAVIGKNYPKKYRDSGKKYLCVAGHHRIYTCRIADNEDFPNLPCEKVYAEILDCSFKNASRVMLSDNFQHDPAFNRTIGKMLSPSTLHRARRGLLFFPDIFERSNRSLAKEWNCDHKTVGHVRDCLISDIKNGTELENGKKFEVPDYCSEDDLKRIKGIIKEGKYIGADGKKYAAQKSVGEDSPPEDNRKSESNGDREADKLRKQKTYYFKQIWDLRKDASRSWIGKGDTDLNQYVSLATLEKVFPKLHDYCADAFRAAMKRTAYATYEDALKRTLESDVSIDDLVKEHRAMSTYAADIHTWNGTTEASQWVRFLIADGKKLAKASQESTEENSAEEEPKIALDLPGLREELERLFALHAKYDPKTLNSDEIAKKFPDYDQSDVALACGQFRARMLDLEMGIMVDMENDHITLADLKDKYPDHDGEVVSAMVSKIEVDRMPADESSPDVDVEEIESEYTKIADEMRTLENWKAMVKDQIKTWKKKRDGVGYASLTMFIHATLKYHSLPHKTEANEEIYEKLMRLLTTNRSSMLEKLIRKQLRGESLWGNEDDKDTEQHQIAFINVGFNFDTAPAITRDDIVMFADEEEDGDFGLSEIPEVALNEIWDVLKRVYPLMQEEGANDA